ncbi:heparan-alpha-glucosaminide N-acetyltransferase domain-containing protein [Georgenia sp. AZ-5]|uniref:heparan-alpha-glucosaminide N-acetyltransferase domain-containing protein n=1 Tax=Georgenia sp. AZ-5 TaxID=3367526 RepID=UPI003754F01C
MTTPAAGHAVDIPHACEPTTLERPAAAPAQTGGQRPDRKGGRLIGVDVARGIALLGMMAVHLFSPATPDGDMSLPWIIAAGKSAALFAVLAGVGIAFSAGRDRLQGRRHAAVAVSLVVRAVIIGVVGLLIGSLVHLDAARVILPYYAVLFVLAIPLLRLRVRSLALLGAAVAVLMPVASHVLRADLPTPPLGNPGLGRLLEDGTGLLTQLSLTGVYPALPWLAYLCVGMAVGRSRLSSRGVVIRLTVAGIALAVAASAASWFALDFLDGRAPLEAAALETMSPEEYTDLVVWGGAGTLPTTTPWWLAVLAPHTSTPVDLAYTIGTSLAALGVAILLGRVWGRVLTPLAKAGSMTFTLYVAHLLMLAAPLSAGSEALDFAIQVAVVVGFAVLWGRRFGRGPLESVVWRATRRTKALVMGRAGGPGEGPRAQPVLARRAGGSHVPLHARPNSAWRMHLAERCQPPTHARQP